VCHPTSDDGALVIVSRFDAFYDSAISQQALFDKEIAPSIASTLHGIHTTVFAYGVTGAGKTHTMQGTIDDPGCASNRTCHMSQNDGRC
jgi:chromosomal replication initiation ATPase DnaA